RYWLSGRRTSSGSFRNSFARRPWIAPNSRDSLKRPSRPRRKLRSHDGMELAHAPGDRRLLARLPEFSLLHGRPFGCDSRIPGHGSRRQRGARPARRAACRVDLILGSRRLRFLRESGFHAYLTLALFTLYLLQEASL